MDDAPPWPGRVFGHGRAVPQRRFGQPPLLRLARFSPLQILLRLALDPLLFPLSSRPDFSLVPVGHFVTGSRVFDDLFGARLFSRPSKWR